MRKVRSGWSWLALGAALAVLGLLALACAPAASKEDVKRVAAEVDKVKAQVGGVDVEKLRAEVSAAVAALAPKTHLLSIFMGEGEVIEEVGGKEVLTGEFHRWEPGVLVVNKGDKVILEVTNPRSHPHSFVLKEFNVDSKELAPRGGKATVEFVANKAGVFQFECGTDYDEKLGKCDPDHRRQLGYLIVLER